ncbi:MAG: ATP-binding cassette domain-containing protein [Candidatus Micrarchaeota archaeon]|nr:ATP-binding cassette domain-containing protein [Candidatus Micrarchaeota archaeon]
MLRLENLSVSIGGKRILDKLNISFGNGIHAVMGPNGSGKSTLAKAIMGLQEYSGSIYFEGKNIDKLSIEKRAQMGIFQLFQHTPHLPGISLFDIFRTLMKDKKPMEIMDMLEKASSKAGLNIAYITKPIDKTWSGGELKKAEMVQMLLLKPKIVISDEIDAGVDVDSLKRIMELIMESKAETVIFISHIPATIERLKPDGITVLKQGKVVAKGKMEMLEKIKKKGYEGF